MPFSAMKRGLYAASIRATSPTSMWMHFFSHLALGAVGLGTLFDEWRERVINDKGGRE
jgi:hypothetical protein